MSLTTTTENSSAKAESQSQTQKPSFKSEAELVRYCGELFEKARKARLQFERQWYINLAFYFGKQYVQWSRGNATTLNRLYEPPAPPWRVRLVSNKIRPITRSELAKVTKERPTAYVIPASSDDDDLAAAKAGEAVFEHIWRTLNMNRMMRRASFWMLLCGTSFMKDWWDEERKTADGEVGVICSEPVSPFHLWVPDTQEEELENQPYIVHGMGKSPEWVETVYGVSLSAESHAGADLLQQKFLQAIGIQDLPKEYVAVKEMWIKPCKKFPNGAKVTWAAETLLDLQEEWGYAHLEYPFTKFDHIPTGRFYADSTIPDLIPLQKEYNRTRSQIIEAKNRMAKPQLIAPKGSINPNKITSEPGLVILYTPGYAKPEPIPLTPLPAYVPQELDRSSADMDDISSQHEITKGRTPPGVTAATAISYLQEQDDSKLAHTVASIEEGVERIGRHFLSLAQQYWEDERAVRVIGDEGTFETLMLKSANIGSDLKVEAGSGTPRSLAAKQAFILELGKMGWVPPDRALKYLNMAETGKLYEELQLDARQAQRENLKMSKGAQVPVNTWDVDAAHLVEHDNFRKKQQFENLPEDIKIIFEQHCMIHRQRLMSQQMAAQQMAAGGAPQTGAAPGSGLWVPPGAALGPGPSSAPGGSQGAG